MAKVLMIRISSADREKSTMGLDVVNYSRKSKQARTLQVTTALFIGSFRERCQESGQRDI